MKKLIFLIFSILILIQFSSCSIIFGKNPTTDEPTTTEPSVSPSLFSLTFETEYGITPETIVDLEKIPTTLPILNAEGYTFVGWYYEKEYITKVYAYDKLTKNTTIYAKWDKITYTINFDNNGHGMNVSAIQKVNSIPTNLPQLNEPKYKFDGWYTDKELTEKVVVGKALSSDITLYAKWIQNSYSVTFDNKGHGDKPISITNASSITSLPELTASGYTFGGWYYDINFNKVANVNDILESNVTLFAKWSANTYTIKFDGNGVDGPNSFNATYDVESILPAAIERIGYRFLNWNTKVDGTGTSYDAGEIIKNLSTKDDVTLYAIWEHIEYKLTITIQNTNNEIKLHYNDTIPTQNTPVVDNFQFNGWLVFDDNEWVPFSFEEAKMPNHNLAIKASFLGEVTITFISDGNVYKTLTGYEGRNLTQTITPPTKEGYTFSGWYEEDTFENKYTLPSTYPNESHNVYAKWSINQYTVTFNPNNEADTTTIELDFNSKLTKPTNPTKVGYSFNGWYYDNKKVDFSTFKMPANDIELKANWTINTYTITLNANGGICDDNYIKGNYNEPIIAPKNPTKEGYTFLYWSIKNSNEEYEFTTVPAENIELIAQWQVNEYNVTFNPDNDNTKVDSVLNYGSKVIKPSDPNKNGYTFLGWYYNNILVDFETFTIPAHDIEIIAKWELNTYDVTFKENGYGGYTPKIEGLTKLPTLPNLTYIGATFDGWYYDEEFTKKANSGDTLTSDVILYAKWTLFGYTITFSNNGHGQTLNPLEAQNTVPTNLPTLNENGYRFEGWYYDRYLKIPANPTDILLDNLTLYAKWVELIDTLDAMTSSNPTNLTIKDYTAKLNATSSGADSLNGAYISIPVSGVDLSQKIYVSIKYKLNGITSIGLHAKGKDSAGSETTKYVANFYPKGWNVTESKFGHSNTMISTAKIETMITGFISLDYICIKLVGPSSSTMEILDFAITTNGIHGFELPDDPTYVSNFTNSSDFIDLEINDKNEQILSYTSSPGWGALDASVTNYESARKILEIKYSANAEFKLWILSFINAESSSIKEVCTAGNNKTLSIDISSLPTQSLFTLRLYIDADVDVTELKTITFHSVKLIDPNNPDTEEKPIPVAPFKPEGTVTVQYTESTEEFANPDRGFYYPICLTAETTGLESINSFTKNFYNNALIHLRVDIAAFSGAYNGSSDLELTTAMLNALDKALTVINESGSCMIIRFAYDRDFGGDYKIKDENGDGVLFEYEPNINMILKHIEQFTPLINKHKNMITAVECGLIGPWGEMHSSTLAEQNTFNKIFKKYLDCLDEDIAFLVRQPNFIYKYYGLTLETLDQFDYENNRIGCYNDGYLGSATDLGTYKDRPKEITFLENLSRFPYGGEVVRPESSYNQLSWACNEMFRTNLSYLNIQWNNIVVKRWQDTIYKLDDPLYHGLSEFTYISNHMGYRFVCESLDYTIKDTLNFTLNFKNVGFGELNRPKNAYVILKNASNQFVFDFEYNNEFSITEQIDLTGIPTGNYEFYFVLADDFTNKAIRGIRFANNDMYNSEILANKLTTIII